MELSTFIVTSLDTIVEEWQAFGRPSAPSLSRSETAEIRDCLKGVLLAIARDMERDGTVAQRHAGAMVREASADSLPSIRHGRLRQQYGIGAGQLVEEFGSPPAQVDKAAVPTAVADAASAPATAAKTQLVNATHAGTVVAPKLV